MHPGLCKACLFRTVPLYSAHAGLTNSEAAILSKLSTVDKAVCFSSRKMSPTDEELENSTRLGSVAKAGVSCGGVTTPQNYSNSTQ